MALELAASIAGLVGLAGLFVQSASTLYTYCHNVPRVGTEVEAVIREIQRLQDTLKPLELVAEPETASIFSTKAVAIIRNLKEEIEQCTADIQTWLQIMRSLKKEDGKPMKNLITRLKSAADKSRFSQMRQQISSHRSQLVVLIDLLEL